MARGSISGRRTRDDGEGGNQGREEEGKKGKEAGKREEESVKIKKKRKLGSQKSKWREKRRILFRKKFAASEVTLKKPGQKEGYAEGQLCKMGQRVPHETLAGKEKEDASSQHL